MERTLPLLLRSDSSQSRVNMAAVLRPQLLLAAILALCPGTLAQQTCSSYGVDYSNGGSYYIDGSSNQYFTFISVFQGKWLRKFC